MLRFLLVAVFVFLILNILAISQLLRIHARRKPLIILIAVACNLMWVFLPWLNARTDSSRFIRALLAPPWFAWLCFVFVYSAVIVLITIVWIPFHKKPFERFAR